MDDDALSICGDARRGRAPLHCVTAQRQRRRVIAACLFVVDPTTIVRRHATRRSLYDHHIATSHDVSRRRQLTNCKSCCLDNAARRGRSTTAAIDLQCTPLQLTGRVARAISDTALSQGHG